MSQKCILVVDDEAAVRKLLGRALPLSGLTVRLAAGGQEAIELYLHNRDTIDLILLDVRMKDMSGPQTLVELRRLDSQVRCCFMSGDAINYSTNDLLALGADDFFPKPFGSLAELSRTLLQIATGET